ncbi:MAG: GNAT family N-acetyltransferase [Erysipelotrichaceae bacterium]|nr:GNAT family N-acetyltransferase [Erysipelotrichaceae bacterium]
MEFTYRKAESSDRQRIAELYEEMLRTIHHCEDVEGYREGYLDKFFSAGDDLIYVAQLREEVVAFLSVEVYGEEGYVYLDDLSVTAECRNNGIGSKLIMMAEDYSRSIGIYTIVFHVDKTNEKAHQLYRKLGYLDNEDQGKRMRMVKELRE